MPSTDDDRPAGAPDRVGVQLVHLRKSMDLFRNRVLEASGHGIEGSGLAVLFHLSSDGPLRSSVLAERLGLDPSTTSRHVAVLQRSGHVERVPDPEDGRASLLQASPDGVRAFADTRKLRNELVARVLEDWDHDHVERFAQDLAHFNDCIQRLDVTDAATAGPEPLTSDRKDPR